MQRARFGIIGAGGIAQNQHIPNMMRSPFIDLVAICDVDESKIETIRRDFGYDGEFTTDYKEVLADPRVDAVVIATREDTHVQLTIDALESGKHVYVEKPLAEDEESCKNVINAQEKSGKLVALGFNRRFAPAYVRAKEILKANGGPQTLQYTLADEFWLRTTRFHPQGHKPGHRMIVEDCHIVDILRWFTDSEVVSVYAAGPRIDEHAITLKFESGAVAVICDSGYVRRDFPKEQLFATAESGCVTVDDFVELNVYGIEGVPETIKFPGHTHPSFDTFHRLLFEIDGSHAMRAMRRAERLRQKKEESYAGSDACSAERWDIERMKPPLTNYMMDKGWQHAIDHFAQCVISGETPKTAGAYDGVISARIIDAAMQSLESGEVVRLSAQA